MCSRRSSAVTGAAAHARTQRAVRLAAPHDRIQVVILPRRKLHEYSLRPRMPSRFTIPLLALLVVTGFSGCVLISADLNPFARRPPPLEEREISGSGSKKVLLMDISGEITSEER